MGDKSTIEWTDATWNPVAGCTIVSPGCTNCYAMRMAARLEAFGQEKYVGTTRKTGGRYKWSGKVVLDHGALTVPETWRKGRRVFVNSMSDLFHEDVPAAFIQEVFRVMAATPRHTYQLLTKRADRLLDLAHHLSWPDNAWMGVSIENEEYLWRADRLRKTAAKVKFLSLEPLLGPLVPGLDLAGIDWAIVGGESGPGARPIHPDWARSIRDQCAAASVPFFFKQWGEWEVALDRERDDPDWRRDYSHVYVDHGKHRWLNLAGGRGFHGERFHVMRRVGKRRAGRLLDGVEHNAFPEPRR